MHAKADAEVIAVRPLLGRPNATVLTEVGRDNLYAVDTSFFPSIGAVNPALTAMANALRVGDHIQNRMARTAGARAPGDGGARGWTRR